MTRGTRHELAGSASRGVGTAPARWGDPSTELGPTVGSRCGTELSDPGVCRHCDLVAVVEVAPFAQTDRAPLRAVRARGERVSGRARGPRTARVAILSSGSASARRSTTSLDELIHVIGVGDVEPTPRARSVVALGTQPAPRTTPWWRRIVDLRFWSLLTHLSSNRRAATSTGWSWCTLRGARLPEVAAASSVGAISPRAVTASSIAWGQRSGLGHRSPAQNPPTILTQ
jgi:hypothetical protein